MKKLILFVALAAVGYAIYAVAIRSPERQACTRMAELCGLDTRSVEADRCTQMLTSLKKSNADAVARAGLCIADAKSCIEAGGCVSGTALSIGAGLLTDFFRGLSKAIK
jgi:hypothetical protein